MTKDKHHLGGLYEDKSIKNSLSTMKIYICSKDVDSMTKKIKENGGTIIKEPFDVFDSGRMGMYKAPEGTDFCIWQGKKEMGLPAIRANEVKHGFPSWFDIYSRNVKDARRFFCNVFGYDYYEKPYGDGSYTFIIKGEEEVFGMSQMSKDEGADVKSHFMVYYYVDNVSKFCEKVKKLGGKVSIPPTVVEGMGYIAMINDPCGVTFGIHSHEVKNKKDMLKENLLLRDELRRCYMKISQMERNNK